MKTHQYEVVIVGGGGAGLMAALYASKSASTAVLSKLYPTRSHTGAAQGGVGAALASSEEDHPEWHTFDTVKGSDYLGDQDAIEFMCEEAVSTVYELEHMGLPFDRTPEGKIAQRPFGGHTNNETGRPVRRACYAADRTGHMILQTLYQQCIKHNVTFFDEFQVLDVLIEDGVTRGVIAVELLTGELHVFHAKAVIFATGGHGRVWEITSNAHSYTGDGVAIPLRRGIPGRDGEGDRPDVRYHLPPPATFSWCPRCRSKPTVSLISVSPDIARGFATAQDPLQRNVAARASILGRRWLLAHAEVYLSSAHFQTQERRPSATGREGPTIIRAARPAPVPLETLTACGII